MKLGFGTDGVDSTDVPQDDDYFNAALAMNAVGLRHNNTAVRRSDYTSSAPGPGAQRGVGIADILIPQDRCRGWA